MISLCATPIARGPNKGKPATGTYTGYSRHWRAGEAACDECAAGSAERTRRWRAANPEAVAEYNRQYHAANREKVAEYDRRRYAANREKLAEYNRQWHAANREKVAERNRRQYAANPEKDAEQNRRWHAANPEKAAEISRRRYARLAGALTIPFTHDQLDQRMSMFGYRCWMCGGPFEQVDHVKPIAKGGPHCLSNLRPACKSCNSAKQDRWPWPLEKAA